jgi:hypothetical protein
MAVFEAVETQIPGGIPARFVAALSVHVVRGRVGGALARGPGDRPGNATPGGGVASPGGSAAWSWRDGAAHGPQDDRSGLATLLQCATIEDLPGL